MTALARAYFSPRVDALEPRYLVTSMLFPVLVVNIYLRGGDEKKPLTPAGIVLLLVLALEIFPGWRAGVSAAAIWKNRQIGQVAVLRAYHSASDQQLYETFVDTRGVREKLAILEKLKYNIFR
jgi:hypothetical protein